jgi:hypothetical protein
LSTVLEKPVKTRASTNVWLVSQQLPALDGLSCLNRLPTAGHVLRRLFYDLKTNKLSLSASCSNVIDEVLQLLYTANISTTQKPNAVAKLKALYEKHAGLGKNKIRRTERQKEMERDFCNLLKKLFDVAHADCESLIKIPEDWAFLQDQRGAMKMAMAEEDMDFKEREERKQQRKQDELRRQKKAMKMAEPATVIQSFSDDEVEKSAAEFTYDDNVDEDDDEPAISKYHQLKIEKHTPQASSSSAAGTAASSVITSHPPKKRRLRHLIDDPLFVASLDRTKTTPSQAMHIVAPALKAAGVEIDDITLSTSSIYRARKSVRTLMGQKQKEMFLPNTPLVAHFDGKLLPGSDGALVDRMPIVVSGLNVEKLLCISKLSTSTGENMGNAVVETLQNWKDVPEWLCGLCFDTTNSNTGIHTGAITVIQRAFDKRLLFLACRHHILELLSTAVFDLFFSLSGPQIAIFSRFKEQWPLIDVTKYNPIDDDSVTPSTKSTLTTTEKQWLYQNRTNIVSFLHKQLNGKTQPRQDYLELIKLSLIMLGESKLIEVDGKGEIHFNPPGAYHRARWMAKGIYCLKMFLFRGQFKLTVQELQALRRISLFTVTIYVKAWFSAPISCDAPLNDLCLLKTLESFSQVDRQVAEAAIKKMRGHLWYLSEDLTALALFSDNVCSNEKQALVAALKKPKMTSDLRRVDPKSVGSFQAMTLSDFVTERSMNLFHALKIDPACLDGEPSKWHDCPTYISAKEKVSAMKVINDCAERAVKLATDFNAALTQDESQRQLVFQIVEYHRQAMPMPLKKNYKTD